MEGDARLPHEIKPTTASVQAVSVKLLEFYASDLAGWLLCTEAQFGLHNITEDETCFWYILASLDAETSARALHITSKAPQGECYSTSFRKLSNKDLLTGSWQTAFSLSLNLVTESPLVDRYPALTLWTLPQA